MTADATLTKPVSVWPYFDKIALWLRQPADKAALAALRQHCAQLHVGNRRARFDGNFHQRLELKQPPDAALRWIASRDDALINQIEVALDFVFANWVDRDDAYDFLDQHMVRRWHGKQRVFIHAGKNKTRYDAQRSARNSLVLYRQIYSRITGELCVMHLEWRANGLHAVRAAGISPGKDLLKFDHREFWKKRLVLCRIVAEDRVGRYLHNRTHSRKRRQPDDRDHRTGHVICNSVGTMQEMIDKYGARFGIQRVMEKLPIEAFLPSDTPYCSIPS